MTTHRQTNVIRAGKFTPLLLAAQGLLFCQGLGSITGTITDPSGGLVPSVTVKITDEGTSAVRATATNTQGYYVFPALRPSTYSLDVESAGFAPSIRKGIILQADESATVNVTLTVQQSSQQVEVTADAAQVNTTNATVSEVVDQRRMVDLPLNGRNAASLLLVVAGATPAPASDVDQGNTKTFPSTITVSTNGSRQNQVSFRLDGANNNDIYTNANQPFPFPDALQEFSVQTSNYSAKYGGNAGGVVNVVTKSGANEVHGDGFEFVRNAVFNARNFFGANRDRLKRNQFGGVIGGPVVIPHLYDGRNRTFFFFGYQGTRIRNISGTSNAYVPTAANLNGDFSALLAANNPANPFGKAVIVNDPKTGQPFPGNQIPVARFDPAAVAFTKYLPQVGGNGKIFYAQPLAQDFNEYVARVDHSISDKDRISGRYFFDRFVNAPFFDKTNYLSAANFSQINSHNALLSETHIVSPAALNEFRASFSRQTSNRGPAPGSISLADLGASLYQPTTGKTLEGINVSGYFNPSQTDPALFIRNQYNLSDDFNWVRGKHNIAFGASAIRGQVLLRNQFRTSGSYTFTADTTNDALASFLLGYVRTFTQGFGEFKDNVLNSYSLYVQDDVHLSRRLTINLGLRYDPQFPWQERKNRIEQFRVDAYNAGTRSQVYTNAPPGLLFPGDPGVPKWGAGELRQHRAARRIRLRSIRRWPHQPSRGRRNVLRCLAGWHL
ncbi:MAG: carboxypeptidase regulatory-like domain-containing protein [Bryobacteraceae bacterium]